jgi:16S rRNA (cytosine967-C5)-methyltransferase
VEQQRQITGLAVQLLRPGGTLLYSTCSLEPAENAEQVLWAERAFGLRLVTSRQRLPQGGPGEAPSEYQDGGFAAVLVKPGG